MSFDDSLCCCFWKRLLKADMQRRGGGGRGRGKQIRRGSSERERRASFTKKKGHWSYFQHVTYSISFIMWKTLALRTAGRDIFIQSFFCQLQR